MSEKPVEPRTRQNRLRRPPPSSTDWEVGELTCPRCGWPAKYLIRPYHESQWSAFGGMCGYCCQQAATHHDKKGWPPFIEPGVVGSITWPGSSTGPTHA